MVSLHLGDETRVFDLDSRGEGPSAREKGETAILFHRLPLNNAIKRSAIRKSEMGRMSLESLQFKINDHHRKLLIRNGMLYLGFV